MADNKAALILAAGQGTRMKSSLPKVLHPCAELPLIVHVIKLALERKCAPIVVVVSPEGTRVRELVTAQFPDAPLRFAVQREPLGTGDATRVGMDAIADHDGQVLILYGDVPLLQSPTVARLQKAAKKAPLAFLTAIVNTPDGYGRVVRQDGRVVRIVEQKDATVAESAISEINAGVYLVEAALLRDGLGKIGRSNAQSEFYLTDVVAMAAAGDGAIGVCVDDIDDIRGVNNRADLALVETIFRQRLIAHHQSLGVTFCDPAGTFIGGAVRLGRDVTVGVGVQLWGKTSVGDRSRIEGPSVIRDASLGSDVTIHAFSHVEGAKVGQHACVGPYARLRPGTFVDDEARVGNFVELKKTHLGKGAKSNHLSYLGDADIGPGSNVGAGTITCNYDGTNKHKTELGEGVFVGSNATLVAPVKIGPGAYVAAGSTITDDVGDDALAIGRARQETRQGYAVKLRERFAARGSAKGAKP